jgi:hypothetical protein
MKVFLVEFADDKNEFRLGFDDIFDLVRKLLIKVFFIYFIN